MKRRLNVKLLAAGAVTVLGLAACGGGGGGSGVIGSGGTGTTTTTTATTQSTVAVGPITGFGSIIVNGIKFDDSSASVNDDNGGLTRNDLRLGMQVEVRGTSNSSTGLGSATSIAVSSEVKGVVENRTSSDFTVLGLTIKTTVNTVYDNGSTISNGDFVEVHGAYDAVNRILVASRIERKTVGEFKLRGVVASLNTATQRFNLGSLQIDYSAVGAVSGLVNGVEVKVYGSTPPAGGVWRVSRVSTLTGTSLSGVARAEIKGVIDQFTSASNFRVNGLTVNAASATFENGTAASLAVGVWVEVDGTVSGSTITATKVEIEGVSSNPSSSTTAGEFEAKGTVSSFVSLASFVVRGTRIDASGTVSFVDGTSAGVANGVCVEVKGTLSATTSGSVVRATRVKFDNDC